MSEETGGNNISLNENYQFILALIMIVSLVVFLAILYNNGDFENAEKLIATFGAFVGVIIGFYFGQKPVQNLTKQVSEASTKVSEATTKTNTAKETLLDYESRVEEDKEIKQALEEKIRAQAELIKKFMEKN